MADRSNYLTPQQEKELEELSTAIRALLIPHKHGSELHTLQGSYYEFYGGPLPFKKLGFSSVTDLLLGLPNAVRIVNKSGQVLLYAVDCKETSHIAKLVRQQKSSKKPKSSGKNSRGRMFSFASYRGRGGRSAASRGHSYPSADSFRKPASKPTTSTADSSYRKSSFGFSKPASSFQQNLSSFSAQPQRQQNSAQNNRTAAVDARIDTTVKAELETLARALGYGVPIYSILPYKGNFMCSVTVGPHRGGSLREYPSRLTAECAAARCALTTCKQYLLTTKSDPQATAEYNRPLQNGNGAGQNINEDVEQDFEHLVENILQLLDKHPSGLLSTHLPAKYFARFGVNLPNDWLNQLEENAHEIAVERIDVFRCIIAKQLAKPPSAVPSVQIQRPDSPPPLYFTNIVPLRKPESPPPIPTPQVAPSLNAGQGDSQLKPRVAFDDTKNAVFEFHMSEEEQALKSQPVIIHPANPRLLRLPESEYFEVFVTVAASPADFFVRIMEPDCANEFNDLRQKMDDYYSKNEGEMIESSSDFLPNRHFYAVREEESWHRVTLVEILAESRQAKVHFIDHGDFETIDFENMRQLEPEFIGCPVQAVRCCLENFEHLGYDDFSEELIEKFQSMVMERSFVAQRYVSAENSGANVYESGSVINLVLYGEDPNNADEFGICLNTAMEAFLAPEKLAEITSPTIIASETNDELVHLAENGEALTNDLNHISLSDTVSSKEDDDEIAGDIAPLSNFDESFDSYVTFAFDPLEFRVRPVTLSAHLSNLTSEMSDFYASSGRGDQLNVPAAKLSEFYAVSIDGSWFRAFCSNPDCPHAVLLFLIDSGEFYSCSLSCLRQLPRRFRRLSSTIIQCSLKNLSPADKSKYYDADTASAFFQKTMGSNETGANARIFTTKVSSHCVKNTPRKPALAFAELDDMVDRETGESLVAWLVANKYAVDISPEN